MSDAAATHPLRATLVMTTKNRKDDLRVALKSAVAQTEPMEVIVIDDGSTDGTSDLVRAEFPTARLVRHETSTGLLVARNEGARLATTPVIFSIDDDAEFSSPTVVADTLACFDHPRIGVVAIPFIDVRKGPEVKQKGQLASGIEVAPYYIGTAHALKRDLFLALGGYREEWFHQGEEGDYCIRMLAAGYVVRLGRSDVIHHYESPKRDTSRMHIYGQRNNLMYTWYNVPLAAMPVHLAGTVLLGLRAAWKAGQLPNALRGLFRGSWASMSHFGKRAPVSGDVYRLMRDLRRGGPKELAAVEPRLPPMRPVTPAAATGRAG